MLLDGFDGHGRGLALRGVPAIFVAHAAQVGDDGYRFIVAQVAPGVPDARREEVLVAVVVLKPDQQVESGSLLALCRDALAAYKVPQQIHLVKREDLPLTGTGKVQKFRLAEQLAAAREPGAA